MEFLSVVVDEDADLMRWLALLGQSDRETYRLIREVARSLFGAEMNQGDLLLL